MKSLKKARLKSRRSWHLKKVASISAVNEDFRARIKMKERRIYSISLHSFSSSTQFYVYAIPTTCQVERNRWLRHRCPSYASAEMLLAADLEKTAHKVCEKFGAHVCVFRWSWRHGHFLFYCFPVLPASPLSLTSSLHWSIPVALFLLLRFAQ